MIYHEDGSLTLEKGETINLDKEIDWIVKEWLPDDLYAGALVFAGVGRTQYTLYPYPVEADEHAA